MRDATKLARKIGPRTGSRPRLDVAGPGCEPHGAGQAFQQEATGFLFEGLELVGQVG
jgi:hypothetical protein